MKQTEDEQRKFREAFEDYLKDPRFAPWPTKVGMSFQFNSMPPSLSSKAFENVRVSRNESDMENIPGKIRYPQDFGRGNPLYVIQLKDEFFEQDPRSIIFGCAWWKGGFENPVLTEEQFEAAHFDMHIFAQKAYDMIKGKERFDIVRY